MVAEGKNSQAAAEHQGGSPSSSTSNPRDGTISNSTLSSQATERSSPEAGKATTGTPNTIGGPMAAPQPPPPSTVHQPNLHYFHHSYHGVPPPPPSAVGYDPSRKILSVGSNDAPTPSTGAPPPPLPGPYTTAQYETRKHAPPLPLPHYQGTAPTVPSQHVVRPPPLAQKNSSPPSAASSSTVGRDPPPLPAHPLAQHFHHPVMHGDHATAATHHHHTYPYPEDRIRGPPTHRAWSNRDFASSAAHCHYYDSSAPSNSASHGFPPAGSYPGNRAPPPGPGPTTKATTLHSGTSQPASVGPYRFSDPTLRREALTSLKTSNTSNSDIATEVDGREGATSPSQIESSHREEVTTMGCTCKKTKCLKLYCQCFAVKIFCGGNCRCMSCRNTADFESERQEAIRMILSRNPQAFDTKFKKSLPDKSRPELSHKLGCKCRKSACMKKYCECYAGNVKCSSNCRCIGCKNMPRGGIPPPSAAPAAPHIALASIPSLSNQKEASSTSNNGIGVLGANAMILLGGGQTGTPARKQREPYMVNAAQNLTFLKHASPADKSAGGPRRTPLQDTGDMGSMPSLASEESPVEQSREESLAVPRGAKAIPEPTTAEKTAVNALLMAAVAMTEMSTHTVATSDVGPSSMSTPPRPSMSTPTDSKKDDQTPQRISEEDYRTPQKNLMRQFQSPKRKQVDIRDGDSFSAVRAPPQKSGDSSTESSPSSVAGNMEVSPKREHSGATSFTPSVQHKIKRSRVGSSRKGPSRDLTSDLHQSNSMVLETPKQSKEVKTELTPVSARCIDFKRMHVHETTTPESKRTNALISSKAKDSPHDATQRPLTAEIQ